MSIAAVGGAILCEGAEVPELPERHAEARDQRHVQVEVRAGPRPRGLEGRVVGGDGGDAMSQRKPGTSSP